MREVLDMTLYQFLNLVTQVGRIEKFPTEAVGHTSKIDWANIRKSAKLARGKGIL